MPNHPNRAHIEAPAMSFEQQVAQVLDSLTKELPMSEPPTGPLDAANEYAKPPRHASSLATTMIPTLGLTFREAADRVRELLSHSAAGHERDEADEGPAADERADWQAEANRLHDAILAAPPATVADLSEKLEQLTCPIFGVGVFVHPNHLQNLAEDVRRMVAAVPDYRGMPTTTIPELGITFAEAAERYRSLRRAEMEANQRGDQGAADDANRQHCRLADQIMDAAPSTPADAMVILSMLADREMGIAAGIDDVRAQRALERMYGLLSTAGHLLPQREEGELSSMVCRWLELRDIASPTNRQMAEHDRLSDRIAAYQPHNSVDALAHLAFVLTCYMGDSIIELRSDESVYARALQKGLAYFAGAGDPSMGTLYRLGPTDSRDEPAFWVCAEPAERVEAVEVGIEGAAEAEDDEEDELPVVDRTGSGLSKAEVRFMNVLDRMGPDDKEGLILTGEAMIALGDAMKAAQKAAAIDRRWSEFFAKLLREDAAKLHPEGDNGLVAANGDSATADPFSDAVEDIGAQASATLSMPLEMTDRMIDAGAGAAGITPEQFKAAVIAARDARAA